MFAIPSPDLLLNLFASGAQVLGLVAVAVGGAVCTKTRTGAASRRAGSPWPFRVALLLLAAVSVSFAMYALGVHDETNRRLQVNLVRKSVEAGKKVGDTSLKTLGFSDQFKHPRAIGSETLASWLAAGKPVNMVDVREPEEIEMGQIAGTWARRYPDLKVNREGLVRAGTETILLCDSGNRSSELSDVFAKEGLHCWFMIGGYEKWVAEHRPLVNEAARTSIRDIPDYPNKGVLLETAEVERLVRDENAVFVDVRYPEEFGKGALPGAINLTLRKMLQSEIEPALHALPRRPVIVPCYDKRSSFFGMILGLRMHRLGYDFRGRYTVPHEYYVPAGEPAHVAAWSAEQAEKTVFSVAAAAVATRLDAGGRDLGGLMWAVLVVVLLARFLLLPLTIKADRDQLVLRGLAPKVAALRARLRDDPARAGKAVMAEYRNARVTPMRNLFGSLLQLVLFIVLFAAVDVAAKEHATPFWWLPGLGAADPLHILPVAVGLAFFAMLVLVSAKVTRGRLALWVALGAVITAATWSLSAAVSLYLLLNIGLMVAQRVIFLRWWRRRTAGTAGSSAEVVRTSPLVPVVPLERAGNAPNTGRKAERLGRLVAAGFPVPQGFVVADERGLVSQNGREAILRAFRRLGAQSVAVRSSSVVEDGESHSRAGEFESLLGVTRERLLDAIGKVQRSLRAPHLAMLPADAGPGGVLVQAMVPAEHAGVLFTEDPACAGAMLVEMTEGLGDQLVSGMVDPEAFRFGRATLQALQQGAPPIDLRPLLELGRRAERLFGRPQDIEWAYARGRFLVLQSRDITCRVHDVANLRIEDAAREAERARLLSLMSGEAGGAEPVVLAQNELTELLPEPTPLSLALMNELWGKDGSVERAATRLGIAYDVPEDPAPYVVSVFGKLYVNRAEERRRLRKGIGALASLRLARGADTMERHYREEFLPRFVREVRLREAVDPARLSLTDLVDAFGETRQRFVRETYVEAEVINLASTFHTDVARRRLRRAGHNPAELLGVAEGTALSRMIANLRTRGDEGLPAVLAECGHRAPHDFELAQPRYRESTDEVRRLMDAARVGASVQRAEAPAPAGLGRIDRLAVATANRFEALKEEAKHTVLRELACLRALALEIGRRLGLGDGVFWLLPEEISASARREELLQLVARRRAAHETLAAVELPSELSLRDLETIASPYSPQAKPAAGVANAALSGLRVAGAGDIVGRARVLRSPDNLAAFEDGDILVARFTDPAWLPLFRRARGIVTEVGGWLSHAAIQAREHHLPAIVGVRGVMTAVRDGDLLCLRADGTIEPVPDRRRAPRVRTKQSVLVHSGEAAIGGQVVDASEGGLRVTMAGGGLVAGRTVQVEIGEVVAKATIVHCQGASSGLLLHQAVDAATRTRSVAG